jgi:hypothetical protein
MPWIKKNLMLVLGGLVGLILLAGSGFFLFSAISRETAVDQQLSDQRNEWTRLHNLTPFPDDKNIKATREEAERMEKLSGALREKINSAEVPPVTDTFGLRLLIENTIADLTREAEAAGVNLPERYAFTFQRLRELGGNFHSNGIPRIAEQVAHISTLCRILYHAKIHSLDTLRRSPVLKEEGGTSDYLTKKPATNRFVNGSAAVIRTPYDLSFRSFSGELADVIRGLAALEECVVIKTLNVEPTSLPHSGPSTMPTMMMPVPSGPTSLPGQYPMPGAGGMDAAMRQRYGLGPGMAPGRGEDSGSGAGMSPELRSRYGLGPPGAGGMSRDMQSRYGLGPQRPGMMTPPQPLSAPTTPMLPSTTTPQPRTPSVVLDEKPLRVILQLDFVTPAPAAAAGRAAPPPRTVDESSAESTDAPADTEPQSE